MFQRAVSTWDSVRVSRLIKSHGSVIKSLQEQNSRSSCLWLPIYKYPAPVSGWMGMSHKGSYWGSHVYFYFRHGLLLPPNCWLVCFIDWVSGFSYFLFYFVVLSSCAMFCFSLPPFVPCSLFSSSYVFHLLSTTCLSKLVFFSYSFSVCQFCSPTSVLCLLCSSCSNSYLCSQGFLVYTISLFLYFNCRALYFCDYFCKLWQVCWLICQQDDTTKKQLGLCPDQTPVYFGVDRTFIKLTTCLSLHFSYIS